MPVNIYDLVEDRKTLRVSQYDLTLTYRPNSLTPAKELALLKTTDPDADDDEAIAMVEANVKRQIQGFADLVEAWDFTGPLAKDADGGRLDIPKALNNEPLEAQAYVEDKGGKLLVKAGDIVPIQVENLMLLPGYFIVSLIRAINEDMTPDPKSRKR